MCTEVAQILYKYEVKDEQKSVAGTLIFFSDFITGDHVHMCMENSGLFLFLCVMLL